jgi:CheY-like chemotaxis protein
MAILVVDDSRDDTQLLKVMLESAGYRDILIADSAESAYQVLGLKDPSQTTKVDLILLDVLMPAVNGIQVCRRIKSIDRLRDIPVIIVTVQSDPVDLQLAFAEGAIDYIRKPLIKVELLARALGFATQLPPRLRGLQCAGAIPFPCSRSSCFILSKNRSESDFT